jgi:molybdopterin converting factor small subunit
MKTATLGDEVLQAMKGLAGTRWSEFSRDETMLGAIVSVCPADLAEPLAAYRDAQRKKEEILARGSELEERITALRAELATLESEGEFLGREARRIAEIKPLGDASYALLVLFSFAYEIANAVRGAMEPDSSPIGYSPAVLEQLIIPALEQRLRQDWSACEVWKAGTHKGCVVAFNGTRGQIFNRVDASFFGQCQVACDDLEKTLSAKKLEAFVKAVCDSVGGVTAAGLKEAIARGERWTRERKNPK